MTGEIVYADLNLPTSFPGALTLGSQCPRWHRSVLLVSGIGNIVLVITVIALGVWVFHLVSEKSQTPGAATPPGSGEPGPAARRAPLERVRSQLCPPAQPGPAGDGGCKLCPTDWRLRRDECYWVSTDVKTWNESRSNCTSRGSRLVVIRDREELAAVQDLAQGSAQFWVGLSHPSPENGWTWLDGSRLDGTRLPVSGPAEGGSCGTVKGNRLHSQSCSSAHQWICQRGAVLL